MKQITAYAIADTDGGRHEPIPLARRIYPNHAAAVGGRKYHGYDPEYYPIVRVTVAVEEDTE